MIELQSKVVSTIRNFDGVTDLLIGEADVHFERACEKYPKMAIVGLSVSENGELTAYGTKEAHDGD